MSYASSARKDTKQPVLLACSMSWCPHCQRLKPAWEEARRKVEQAGLNVEMRNVDLDKTSDRGEALLDTLAEYGIQVEGYPTIVALPSGRRFSKARSPENLFAFAQELAQIPS